jgi:glycosyltransferase involved in cell wall biosynthesis
MTNFEEHIFVNSSCGRLLRSFDHIVFSTRNGRRSCMRSITANCRSTRSSRMRCRRGQPVLHQAHAPFRLLFLGRFVAFKNLLSLMDALAAVPDMTLTLVGSGPMEERLRARVAEMALQDRVTSSAAADRASQAAGFCEHDLLVLPSFTESARMRRWKRGWRDCPFFSERETGLSASALAGDAAA